MKLRSVLLLHGLLLLLFTFSAQAIVHTQNKSHQIAVPDQWVESMVGSVVFDADFNLVNAETGDMMLVDLIPQGYLLNLNEELDQNGLVALLKQFNAKHGATQYHQEGEVITGLIHQHDGLSPYLYFQTKLPQAKNHNQVLISNSGDFTVWVKVINKGTSVHTQQQILKLVSGMNPITSGHQEEPENTVQSPFGYQVLNGSGQYKSDLNVVTNDTFDYFSVAFAEDDRVSRYMISSQCTGMMVPDDLYFGLVLDDFGMETVDYAGDMVFNGKSVPLVLTQYNASDTQYHVIGAVLNGNECQHVVAYVTERQHTLSDRFFDFLWAFQLTGEPFDFDRLNEDGKNRYLQTIQGLAQSMSQMEMYEQASQLYAGVYSGDFNEKMFYGQLAALYNANQYHEVLEKIALSDGKYNNNRTRSWQAWSHARLKQNSQAIDTFTNMMANGAVEDEDVFKYLDLLSAQSDKHNNYFEVVDQVRPKVKDITKLDFKVAQKQTQLKMPAAKDAVLKLLNNPLGARNYQFDLMDLLDDLSLYEEVEAYCLDKINNGYESAGLWNYLGDAQNKLERYDDAYRSMLKAHELSPDSDNINSYLRVLRNKVGKSNLSELSDDINPLELPAEIARKLEDIKPLHSDSSYEYLYQLNVYRHESESPNKKTHFGKIKINNLSGVHHNKTLEFGFDSEYEEITVNSFKVLDENGQLLSTLDHSTMYVSGDEDDMADSSKVLNIPVPSIGVGVMIEWVVSVASKTNDVTQEFVEMNFVSRVGHQYKGMVFQGSMDGIAFDHTAEVVTQVSQEGWHYWATEQVPNFKKTPYLPDLQQVFPWVKLGSVKPSWQAVGAGYLSKIDNKINADLSSHLDEISTDFEGLDELSKVQHLAAFVQQKLTYQALEFGWRAFIPNSSELTLRNRYGDCKDHAVLLHDLLSSAGIKSHLALVNSSNDISEKLASMGQFDHMIVYVPDVNGGMYLDPTDKDVSYYHYNPPTSLQNHQVLALDAEQSFLVKIPPTNGELNTIAVDRMVSTTEHHYMYQEKAVYHGYLAENLRSYLKGIEVDEVESRIMSWVSSYYPDVILTSFKYENLYDLQQPLELTFQFSQHKDYAVNKLPVFTERYVMDFAHAPRRSWDFEIENSFRIKSTTRKSGKGIKFVNVNQKVDDELTRWQVHSDKSKINFEAEVFATQKPAKDYTKLVNLSKQGILALEAAVKN